MWIPSAPEVDASPIDWGWIDPFLAYAVPWSAVVQAVFVIFAVIFGLRQLTLAGKARELQFLQELFAIMRERKNAKLVQRALSLGGEVTQWSQADRLTAERSTELFQQMAFYATEGFVRSRLLFRMYSLLILNAWHVLHPFVEAERTRMNTPGFAIDFERLADNARRYRVDKGLPVDGKAARPASESLFVQTRWPI